MKIRTASSKDAPGIRALIKANAANLAQDSLPKISEFFVADEKGVIVGCCALVVYSKRLGEVRSLAVVPEFRGKGLATRLVKACVTKAHKQKVYELIAITGALKFFNNLGFTALQRDKFALLKVLGK